MTMTLETEIRRLMQRYAVEVTDEHGTFMAVRSTDLAMALQAHLTTPPEIPVSAGGAVGILSIDNFRDCRSMQNVQFDYTGDLPVGTHKLYATPPPPAGFRVVPVEFGDDFIDAMCEVVCVEAGESFSALDNFTKGCLRDTQRKALQAAITVAAHDAGGV